MSSESVGMNNWIGLSLEEAVLRLDGRKDADLICDMQRIREICEGHLDDVHWHPGTDGILDALMFSQSLGDISDVMETMREIYELQHVNISVVDEIGLCFETRMLTTYSASWVKEYISEKYKLSDPQYLQPVAGRSFFWGEMEDLPPFVHDYLRKAKRAGVGPSGYTCWLEVTRGTILAVTITASSEPNAFRDKVKKMKLDLKNVFSELGSAFARANGIVSTHFSEASDGDLALLRAVVSGSSQTEVTYLLETTGPGMGSVERVCKRFGVKTLAQAAAIAASQGLLSLAPLGMDECWFTHDDNAERPEMVSRNTGLSGVFAVRHLKHGWAVYRDGKRISEIFENESHAERACTLGAWGKPPKVDSTIRETLRARRSSEPLSAAS